MGFFLTVEGCDGAGKTTAVEFIRGWLESKSMPYEQTREPGGTALAEQIRQLLLANHKEAVADTTELLMMFAARSQNIHENIKPGLALGKVILCDRFTDATYAYQGGGRGVNLSHIAVLEEMVQGALRPDMTLLLDIDPSIGLVRAKYCEAALDRIEQEKINFFERVRAMYLKRAQQFPGQYAVIDASCPVENVQLQIEQVLVQRLGVNE
ncbi:MAG: dTMP kinase [Endozoicomonas sp. (ex Botrylloides leachii)]|nr:dTMP kinase [Endozoicomonas sp. (ex Botrylloides leachii)]